MNSIYTSSNYYRGMGRGEFEVTISLKYARIYKIDIQSPGEGPGYLFVTLNRICPKDMKMKQEL